MIPSLTLILRFFTDSRQFILLELLVNQRAGVSLLFCLFCFVSAYRVELIAELCGLVFDRLVCEPVVDNAQIKWHFEFLIIVSDVCWLALMNERMSFPPMN